MSEPHQHTNVRIHIDRTAHESPNPTTGASLYALGHIDHHCHLFRASSGDQEDQLILRDETAVHLKADAHFYSQKDTFIADNAEKKEIAEEIVILEELIDLEEWAKADKKQCRAHKYRIRIDKDYKVVEVHSMTGREILALVQKTPETYLLSQKFRGGRVDPIKADQIIEFHHHQIERFQTLALDPTEG